MRRTLLYLLIFILFPIFGFSQNEIAISGKIVNAKTQQAIPYATVSLLNNDSNKLITGTATLPDGSFSINTASSNEFYVEIRFMGYTTKTIRNIEIKKATVNLGTIELLPDAKSLNEVTVTAEKSSLELKLDKRVFNVGQDISSSGMGAMEVLNSVPSVNVDIEGNITLRGNSGVLILINGKPSVLTDDPANALASISSDMIERIEVITNPSAKYEAEGTSGIINIVLKKEDKKGLNGSVSANIGWPHNHSVGVSLNNRSEKFNLFTQFGAGYRSLPRYNRSENINYNNNIEVNSDGVDYRNENFYNITLGSDYYLNDLNVITLSGSFAYEIEDQPSETEFWVYDNDQLISNYVRNRTAHATNPKYRYDFQYSREFKDNEEHKLIFSALGNFFGKDLTSDFSNTLKSGAAVFGEQKTETSYYQEDYTYKLDYTKPINDKITLETGALYEVNDVGNDFTVFDNIDGELIRDNDFSNNFEYIQKVLGIYATGAYEDTRWGIKVGLRFENTVLNTLLTNTGERNDQNFSNLFPTVHTSYKFSKTASIQAGYSKRIFRPRLWDLNPFINVQNIYNVRSGNPNLLPEYADSYELTGVFMFKKISFNTSLYYLYTTDVIDRVATFQDDLTITLPMNIGTRDKIGLELNGKYSPKRWITFTGDANYGFFNRSGVFENKDFNFEGDQWSSRLTTKIKFPKNFDFEITTNYRSGFETVQGEVSGYAFVDAGLRKKLKDGKMVFNLSVRDAFASRIRESIVDQRNNYLSSFSQRGRFLTLSFSYGFGKGEAMTYTGRRR